MKHGKSCAFSVGMWEAYFIVLLKRPFQCPGLNAKLVQTSEDMGCVGSSG